MHADVIADQASKAAAAARLAASDAAAAAAAACDAARECLGKATADEAEGLPLPAPTKEAAAGAAAATVGPESPPTFEDVPPEETADPGQPKTGDGAPSGQPAGAGTALRRGCRCGPDVTLDFLETMRWLVEQLRKTNTKKLPKPLGPPLPDKLKPGISQGLSATAWAASWVDPDLAYGLIWMYNNGHQLDFWPFPVDDCGCDPCNGTVTFRDQCLPQHSLGDWMYGMCCGYFGFPEELRNLGGHFAENQKMLEANGTVNWEKANAWGGWIRLDPEVSRRLYKAGAEVGKKLREDPGLNLYDEDFDGLLRAADRQPGCTKCTRRAGAFDRKVSDWPIIF